MALLLFFGIFVIAVCLVVGLLILSVFRPNVFRASQRFMLISVAVGYIVTYLVCLCLVFISPYWDDNGATETILFPAHFAWALVSASFFQFFIVPITIGIMRVFRRFRQ
jgi:hypothetical protein